jgi:hypothetical protein
MDAFKEYLCAQGANKLVDEQTLSDINDNDLIIAVMDRSWVFIGFVTKLHDGRIRLDCCHNIHRWGTTEGLGELAVKGPLSDTVLNKSGPIYGVPIFMMKVEDEKWLS